MKTKAAKAAPATQNKHAHDHGDGECCGHDHGAHDHGLMCEMHLRQYTTADYKELKAVWKAGDIKLDDTDSAKSIAGNLKRFKSSYRVFVAEAQMVDVKKNAAVGKARIAGGVVATFDGHRVYVYHLAVHPDFRSVGLGKALLETCERQAKLWGAKHLRLSARRDPSRAPARRMYESAGWVADESISIYRKTLD